ncbi:MAG: anhydro-N-acetylmuramic acid kinase [Deltaproteobacteria bacterium]|nr:anhydro-N-acetylmuramic acid kinase [Deltaproteobacteria bacterium]
MASKTWTVIGLMSGTSTDGIDAALVRLRPGGARYGVRVEAFRTLPFQRALRRRLLAVASGQPLPVSVLSGLNVELGEALAAAARAIACSAGVRLGQVDLIGSHGHTVWHGPPGSGRTQPPSTLQIGEPAVIAARCGVTTVADFRPADLAHGGQGAPLTPYVHWLLFRHPSRGRVINNIGGIAHPTFLPAGGGVDAIAGFDSGPGNMVIDAITAHVSAGRLSYDRDGRLAARGRVDGAVLRELLAHPYFRRRPPKTTGRELFGEAMVARLLAAGRRRRLTDSDLVATATAFTARSLGDAYRRFLLPQGRIDEIYFSGGGSRNPTLMAMLRAEIAYARVGVIDELGVAGDALEAVAFAVLAVEAVRGRPANVPAVTGARRPAILGKIIPVAAIPH